MSKVINSSDWSSSLCKCTRFQLAKIFMCLYKLKVKYNIINFINTEQLEPHIFTDFILSSHYCRVTTDVSTLSVLYKLPKNRSFNIKIFYFTLMADGHFFWFFIGFSDWKLFLYWVFRVKETEKGTQIKN